MQKNLALTAQIMIDVVALSVSFWLAFALRFDWDIPSTTLHRALVIWPVVVGAQYALLVANGVTRIAWRYVGLRDVVAILYVTALASGCFFVLRFGGAAAKQSWKPAEYLILPMSVNAIDFVLTFLGVVGVRVVRRIISEQVAVAATQRFGSSRRKVFTLLIGAGQGGVMVAKELKARPDLGIVPVAFIDDDSLKVGTRIHGIPVAGTMANLAEVAERFGAREALVTISNAPGSALRTIAERCRAAGVEAKIVPGLHEIVGGRVNLSRIRHVAIDDLLRRDPVQLDTAAIADVISGRVAMVTGAGGSIGAELCRQLVRFRPRQVVLVEKSENALFETHRELEQIIDESVTVVPCVADICDEARVRSLFGKYRPHVVFHAAAHKHVPMMERDAGEAVKNNVFGTKIVADLASEYGAHAFVMISTDKAVNPTSVMGATKRIAETYTQALSGHSSTRFVTVRFGNVLGSNGSVIPIFKEQIAAGGPITVTHPEMRRYFMTIPEACQLVLQAASMGRGGEIFVLDMGDPVKIVDLAADLVRLSGFSEKEIGIVFTGTRPGEKLFEELLLDEESVEKTRHPKVYVGRTRVTDFGIVKQSIEALLDVRNSSDPDEVRRALSKLVAEYRPSPRRTSAPPAPLSAAASASGDDANLLTEPRLSPTTS